MPISASEMDFSIAYLDPLIAEVEGAGRPGRDPVFTLATAVSRSPVAHPLLPFTDTEGLYERGLGRGRVQ